MNFPNDVKYTKTHEWVRFEDETTARIGITDYAQDQLGDLVFVNLPAEGDQLVCGDAFADVESVKAVSDVNAPVSGTVDEVNEALLDAPEMMNEAPYDAWFVLVSGITDTDELMEAEEYEAYIETL
ncbi:MAG: glycine cleavage system protein GcvH [Lachnospiraceae bacterium]|nr:glycine cleavage system protein GcvH [Lachnospiraceae bacterium]